MDSQMEVDWTSRDVLTDWLVQVHARFCLVPKTLFLMVNIFDRLLSAQIVSLAKLQLVGITSLLIASKVKEIVPSSITLFLHCANRSYTKDEVLEAERYILKMLGWNLSYPNPIHFLRRVGKASEFDVEARTISEYLLKILCLEWRLLSAPPSLLAAAAIWLTCLILGNETWVCQFSSARYSADYPADA